MKRKQQLWGFIAAVVLAAAFLLPFCADAEQPKAKPAVKPAPAQNDPFLLTHHLLDALSY